MELFGIGPLELLFILLLALIIFGPKDLQKTGRTLGRSLNRLVHSDTWKVFNQVSSKIRTLPTTLMREANLEDLVKAEASGELRVDARILPVVDPRVKPTDLPPVIIGDGSQAEPPPGE